MVIAPGVSIGLFPEIGSVGLVVKPPNGEGTFVLSCSHVLALCGYAQAGDDIVSDGGLVGAGPYSKVGSLTPYSSVLTITSPNDADFALCAIDPQNSIQSDIPGFGPPSGVFNLDAQYFSSFEGAPVFRVGAKTGPQHGTVVGWDPLNLVAFQDMPISGGIVSYSNAIKYETSCDSGDSGAAVVAVATGQVLGIHLGGQPSSGYGYFCPLGMTLLQWNLVLA